MSVNNLPITTNINDNHVVSLEDTMMLCNFFLSMPDMRVSAMRNGV
jgi:hypothetical protein